MIINLLSFDPLSKTNLGTKKPDTIFIKSDIIDLAFLFETKKCDVPLTLSKICK